MWFEVFRRAILRLLLQPRLSLSSICFSQPLAPRVEIVPKSSFLFNAIVFNKLYRLFLKSRAEMLHDLEKHH